MPAHLPLLASLLCAFCFVAGCKRDTPSNGTPGASGAVSGTTTSASAASGAASGAASAESGDDEVAPVYPLDPGPPNPLVERLCKAIHELPEQRRADCCKQPLGLVLTSECTRNLGAAVNAKAVTLVAAEIDACEAAIAKAYVGCEWVGPNRPSTPAACVVVLHGALPANTRCRSSLECVDGLRCHGAGPTTPGTCAPPHAKEGSCGFEVDVLVTYTAQSDWEARHPECTGTCDKRRCVDVLADGAACAYDSACGAGHVCATGKCAAVVAAKLGEACPTGACADPDARCLLKKCVAPKGDGEKCALDTECRGGCLKSAPGAKEGKCGRRCDLR